uniref:Sulfotransferase domain-containing protein n=1 Tax=Lotharella globosa TaxID=91324 RepID=A0A7S4DQE5_9EUKA|mmetsp:Transcript_19169/g.38763  ORF Transcript_19169/g.38763 Transcript_19169/m.38763 type:complete len:819 (+) Transcript_19169:188-2644(+)
MSVLGLVLTLALGAQGAWRSKHLDTDGSDLVATADDGSIHVCIFSDRVEGLKGTLKSTALNAAEPEKVHIWIVTDNTTAIDIVADYLFDTGLHIHALELDEVVDGILQNGYKPVWTWDSYNISVKDDQANWDPKWANENTARPDTWDHSTMHMHPLNHLRFYIPYIEQFKQLDRIIFMDDDLIIQGDMRQAWDAKENLPKGKMLVGACEIWKWGDETGSFVYSGKDSSYAKSSALAQTGRDIKDTFCTSDDQVGCVGKNHWKNLDKLNREINGKPFDAESQPEWNFGFTLFDLEAWRELHVTENYEKWMHANYDDHIFPETSLMYGLGIPFMAYYDRVSCWDDVTEPKINVRDGFGYIQYPEFLYNGLDATYLTSGFVLHYDGWIKPWMPEADPIFAIPYEKTMAGVKFADYKSIIEDPKSGLPEYNLKNSFVVLSDNRAGSGWFMDLISEHPEICASGLHNNDRTTYPIDVLVPFDKSFSKFEKKRAMTNQCYFSFIEHYLPQVMANKKTWCSTKYQTTLMQESQHAKLDKAAVEIKDHMPMLCQWAESHGSKQMNSTTLFDEYYQKLVSADSSAWACRCPAGAKTIGTRVLTDWVGSTFVAQGHGNLDMNFDDLGNTLKTESDGVSLLENLARHKTKVIFFKRDILEEMVSRRVATETKIFSSQTEEISDYVTRMSKGLEFAPVALANELKRRETHRNFLNKKLASLGVDVLDLDYSECKAKVSLCIKKVEKFLRVSTHDGYKAQTVVSVKRPIQEVVKNFDEVMDEILKHPEIEAMASHITLEHADTLADEPEDSKKPKMSRLYTNDLAQMESEF